MSESAGQGKWARRATRLALILSIGAVVAALAAALGSANGAWNFRAGLTALRYAFFAAAAGALVAIVALVLARRQGRLMLQAALALVVGLGFVAYLGAKVRTARSLPPIHDIATNLDDVPQFTRLKVRADNLENIPDMGKPELKAMEPEARWKALHRTGYGDIHTVRLATDPAHAIQRAEALAKERGWEVARTDPAAGILEATDTSLFFRFKDDVVVRARSAPGGGTLLDMRSISRVGQSDVGVNGQRVRAFLKDMQAG
jgi:uncharacterized protein (DUF1499 family)